MIFCASSSPKSDGDRLSVVEMNPIVWSFDSCAAPCWLSGLTTWLTCLVFSSELTASSTACLLSESVSFPFFATSTMGLLPFACSGSLSLRRSWALVDSLPGIVRLLLVLSPRLNEERLSTTTTTTHAAITGQWWRAQKRPRRYRKPVSGGPFAPAPREIGRPPRSSHS